MILSCYNKNLQSSTLDQQLKTVKIYHYLGLIKGSYWFADE